MRRDVLYQMWIRKEIQMSMGVALLCEYCANGSLCVKVRGWLKGRCPECHTIFGSVVLIVRVEAIFDLPFNTLSNSM